MIFISVPYSHKYREVTEKRVQIAAYYAAHLLTNLGKIPISPVLIGDRIRQEVNLPGDFDTWNDLCYTYLKFSDEMHVLMLDGWIESKGIDAEIDFARENNIQIKYIECFQPVPTDGVYHFKENETMKKKENMYHKLQVVKKTIIDNCDDDVKLRFT